MKYTVTGALPIATKTGDIPAGGTFDDGDLADGVLVDMLIAAGHVQAVKAKLAKADG